MPKSKPPGRPTSTRVAGELDVFVNCPFDDAYRPLFRSAVFAVSFCGFKPRSALEKSNSGEPRITKILRIIRECWLGIHDISRTGLDPGSHLPRFNMPFELGIFLGMMHSGADAQSQKECLILDREPYRYRKFLSDISGQDIEAHDNKVAIVVAKVRDWLNDTKLLSNLPGPDRINESYGRFAADLDAWAIGAGFRSVKVLSYSDMLTYLWSWKDSVTGARAAPGAKPRGAK